MKVTNKMQLYRLNYFLYQLYVFGAMFSPIITSTRLYLEYMVVFTQVAAGWCLGCVSTHPGHQPAATWVNTTRYSLVLLMMGEKIAPNT